MTYIPSIATVDGVALSTLGLIVEGAPGFRHMVTRSFPSAATPGYPGEARLTGEPTVLVREFTVAGVLMAASVAALETAYRNLQFYVGGPSPHELVLVDDTTKHILVSCTGMTREDLGQEVGAANARVTIAWRALDSYWEDEADTTVSLSTTPAACALGTAPCFPVITINQSCVITLKDGNAATVATMTLTGVSGAQTAIIDMAAKEITHSVSGYAPQLRTAGRYFQLDPHDGWYPLAIWPTLQLSTGTGSVTYAKRWA